MARVDMVYFPDNIEIEEEKEKELCGYMIRYHPTDWMQCANPKPCELHKDIPKQVERMTTAGWCGCASRRTPGHGK